MSEFDDNIVSEFLLESLENLETLEHELLVLERHPESKETLGSIFRTIHTLKGTCGFLGYSRLEAVAHVAESLLGRLRSGEIPFDGSIATLLGSLVDTVRAMLVHIERHRTESDVDTSELVEALRQAQSRVAADPAAPGAGPAADAPASPGPAPASDPAPPPGRTPDAAPTARPAGSPGRPGPRRIFDEMIEQGRLDAEQVDLALRQQRLGDPRRLGEILVDNGALQPHEVLEALVANGLGPQSPTVRSTIRVDVRLLERLMNQVGELVLARNQLLQLMSTRHWDAMPGASQRLNAITTELQDAILRTRMQPIQVVWSQLPRLCRDVARSCGKSIRLETEGAGTELDKTLLEAIKDPLVHLVRNAVDHGIESPEARAARGKPAEGRVRLRASHEGGLVVIEVSDDGGGIDPALVRERARRKGLITEERAARMSDEEAVALIFTPGFSTAESVTRVSGRGVGMDVAKTNVERIGGTLEVRSRPGEGTLMQIKIPLTLAIVPALCVSSGDCEYAIPQVNVMEILRLDPARGRTIEWVQGAAVTRLRGSLLPILFLERLLESGAGPTAAEAESRALQVVVLETEARRFGLVVDAVGGFREIVVKPLVRRLLQPALFAGATVLGDGRVALILDARRIAARAGLAPGLAPAEAGTPEPAAPAAGESYLWFEIREDWPVVLPLSEIVRLEEVEAARVRRIHRQAAVLHRDELIPLVPVADALDGAPATEAGASDRVRVVVIDDGGRSVGLVVHRVLDVVRGPVGLDPWTARFGIRGSVVVDGRPVEVLDPKPIARRLRARASAAGAGS